MKLKLIKSLIIAVMLLFNYYSVYATDLNLYKPPVTNSYLLMNMAGKILGYISIIGVVVSVVTVAIVGIKYLLGSVEEKAEYKNRTITFLVGAFLVFSVTTVPNAIYVLTNETATTEGTTTTEETTTEQPSREGNVIIHCPSCGVSREIRETLYMKNNGKFKCISCGYNGDEIWK